MQTTNEAAANLTATLLGSSDAPSLARYDAQIAFLDDLIAANEAAIHTATTVVPPAPTELEQQLFASLARVDRTACEYVATLPVDKLSREEQVEIHPLLPLMLEMAKPCRELVAIGALTFHQGPCCSECDGSGLIDTGHNHHGRHVHETCCKCGVESYGEVSSRGMRCPGVFGESCADGIHAAHLTDGAFELPSGALCCRACAAVACGYRAVDDEIDLGILTALELQERA